MKPITLSTAFFSLGLAFSTHAANSVLNFDDLVLGDFNAIPSTYGSGMANTPHIQVRYRTFNPGEGTDVPQGFFWNDGVGDLHRVLEGNVDGSFTQLIFHPDPGYRVTVNSFDMAGWFQRDVPDQVVDVLTGHGSLFHFEGTIHGGPGEEGGDGGGDGGEGGGEGGPLFFVTDLLGEPPTHDTFMGPWFSDEDLILQFGPSWDVGMDNVSFSETRLDGTPVPEVSPFAVAAALVGFVFARRFARSAKAA